MSDRLAEVVTATDGITRVRVASAQPMGERWLVYMEVDVTPGLNTNLTAVMLRLLAVNLLGTDEIEFSAILWDGVGSAIDYTWDDRAKEFRTTVLSIVPSD